MRRSRSASPDQLENRVSQLRAVEHLDHLPAVVPRLFVEHGRAASRRQRPGVHHLVLARQVDLRHDDGRQPERGHLVQRAGARADNREVGERVELLDVVEERPRHVEARRWRGARPRCSAARRRACTSAPGSGAPSPRRRPVPWMMKSRSLCGRSAPSASTSARLIVRAPCDPPNANTTWRPAGTAEVKRRARRVAIPLLDAAPQRIPGHRPVLGKGRERIGKRHEHAIGQAPHEQVQLAGRRVLLVHIDASPTSRPIRRRMAAASIVGADA